MSVLQPTTNIRTQPEIFVLCRDHKLIAQVIISAADRFGAWTDEPANPPLLGRILQARDVFNRGIDVQHRSILGADLGLEAVLNYITVHLD